MKSSLHPKVSSVSPPTYKGRMVYVNLIEVWTLGSGGLLEGDLGGEALRFGLEGTRGDPAAGGQHTNGHVGPKCLCICMII